RYRVAAGVLRRIAPFQLRRDIAPAAAGVHLLQRNRAALVDDRAVQGESLRTDGHGEAEKKHRADPDPVHGRALLFLGMRRRMYWRRATALVCAVSRASKTRVTVPCSRNNSCNAFTASGSASSSLPYRPRKPSHFAGSWPNHCRSAPDGAISFSQASSFSFSFEMPRGQRRSTSTRAPSDFAGGSVARLSLSSIRCSLCFRGRERHYVLFWCNRP